MSSPIRLMRIAHSHDVMNSTIVERIITDHAGEWGWTSGAKERLSAKVNVELVLRPTQSDKRLNARGEANVKILVRQAQRIMLRVLESSTAWFSYDTI